jgi:DNA topoisomerase-1
VLDLSKKDTKRIVFHEITKNAILSAIENPRQIDLALVDAQQARRVLDRIVGFELSPILWKKIKPSLSAGRVQSVAVKLIVEREREIRDFKAESNYKVTALFSATDGSELKAELAKRFTTKEEAQAFLEKCQSAQFTISDVITRPAKRTPAPPFTTSTLQQEASRKLGFSVSQTMSIAQRLYESGKITYMRTDSVNLSALALNTAKAEIIAFAGENYSKVRNYTTKAKGAQEAHEAIRPTYISEHTISGTKQEKSLYELIWKRTVASQMADAELSKTTITIGISNSAENFVATGEVLVFDGFLKVYMEGRDDEEEQDNMTLLPALKAGDALTYQQIDCTERFTQRPARYTEASLVRKMEELGIGRPSTYAPTISTILNREYVVKADREGEQRTYNVLRLQNNQLADLQQTETVGTEKAKLFPTDTGSVVNDYLQDHFNYILDYNFTANIEQELDLVAEGKEPWKTTIDKFYQIFHPLIETSSKEHTEHRVGERILGIDPTSGKEVSVKISRYGVVAQIGSATDSEKPKFASLKAGQSLETITLEEALELFKLPRTIGEWEGKEIKANVGRFGPYLAHNGVFCSIPKDLDPMSITLEESIQLLTEKRTAEANKVVKVFDEDADMRLLNGRYGVYLCKNKTNYKLPKGCEPTALTYQDCLQIIAEAGETKPKTKGRKSQKQ